MTKKIQLDEFESKLCEIALKLEKLIGQEKALEIISEIHLYYLSTKEKKKKNNDPEINLNIMEAGL